MVRLRFDRRGSRIRPLVRGSFVMALSRSIVVVAAVLSLRITRVAGHLRVGMKRTADRHGQAVTTQEECSEKST